MKANTTMRISPMRRWVYDPLPRNPKKTHHQPLLLRRRRSHYRMKWQ
jgi:hypothetical protein